MTHIQSIILGIVEGFTEFLPISSTAHLVVASWVLKINQSEFVKTFEIAIQLGAILAIVVLYWNNFIKDWTTNKKLIVAFIPTAIIGLAFYKIVKNVFLATPLLSLWMLLLGGIFIVIFERYHKHNQAAIQNLSEISYKKSFLIGLSQSLAIVPGVSRAAATIIGGLFMGISKEVIVEFSFLLAVPTMAAATGLDLLKSYKLLNGDNLTVLGIGFVVSFITAIISVKWLLKYIKKHNFTSFGIYRIVFALIFLFLL